MTAFPTEDDPVRGMDDDSSEDELPASLAGTLRFVGLRVYYRSWFFTVNHLEVIAGEVSRKVLRGEFLTDPLLSFTGPAGPGGQASHLPVVAELIAPRLSQPSECYEPEITRTSGRILPGTS